MMKREYLTTLADTSNKYEQFKGKTWTDLANWVLVLQGRVERLSGDPSGPVDPVRVVDSTKTESFVPPLRVEDTIQ